jgi:hypothetical protein
MLEYSSINKMQAKYLFVVTNLRFSFYQYCFLILVSKQSGFIFLQNFKQVISLENFYVALEKILIGRMIIKGHTTEVPLIEHFSACDLKEKRCKGPLPSAGDIRKLIIRRI